MNGKGNMILKKALSAALSCALVGVSLPAYAASSVASELPAEAIAAQQQAELDETNCIKFGEKILQLLGIWTPQFVVEDGQLHYSTEKGKYDSFTPGFITLKDNVYYIAADGVTFTAFEPGLVTLEGKLYEVSGDGYSFVKHAPGFVTRGGERYYAAADGYSFTSYTPGFVTLDGKLYHVEADGVRFTPVAAGFVMVDGKLCHGSGDGYSIDTYEPGLATIDGGLYYVNADGCSFINAAKGLYTFGTDLYYVPEDGAAFLTNGKVGYLEFGADGRYTSGNAELDSYVAQALAACTNESMTKSEKLRAAYLYVRDNGSYLARDHQPRGSTAWAEESALFFLKNKRGNCYCFAGSFLYLARQIGYQAYPISGGVGFANKDHAWVMVPASDGADYIYDVELEYAYRYRYEQKKNLNLYKMTTKTAPFLYHFPA